MAHVDVYVFMCPNCGGNGDPAGTVATIVTGLANQGLQGVYGMLWFDIEQCDGCWADAATNANYIAQAVNQAVAMGVHIGVYSSEYEWGATVGGWTGLSSYPQWYADWDGGQNFGDNTHYYGGWTTPSIKQYADSGACFDVDSSWYPDSSDWRARVLNSTQPLIDLNELNAWFRSRNSTTTVKH